MSVINQIKRMAGQSADLEIKPPHTYFTPGHPIWFESIITANQPVTVRTVRGELLGGEGQGELALEEARPALEFEIARDLTLEEGQSVHLTASVPLPEDIRPTTVSTDQPYRWIIRVTLDIPNGLDITKSVPVVVAPAITGTWKTEQPLIARDDQRSPWAWEVTGHFVVACPEGVDPSALVSLVNRALVDALGEYLEAEPDLPTRLETEGISELCVEVAGAVREIVVPHVRAAESLPLDFVADVTIEELVCTRPSVE